MSDTLFEIPPAEVVLIYYRYHTLHEVECGSVDDACGIAWGILDDGGGYPERLHLRDGTVIDHDEFHRMILEWSERNVPDV